MKIYSLPIADFDAADSDRRRRAVNIDRGRHPVAHPVNNHGRSLWLLAALLAVTVTCVVFAIIPGAARAGEGHYCTNVWLANHNEACSAGFGLNNTILLAGSGAQHSVCVHMFAGSVRCSGGPGEAVYNETMRGCTTACGIPEIYNNGFSSNQVWGFYVYS